MHTEDTNCPMCHEPRTGRMKLVGCDRYHAKATEATFDEEQFLFFAQGTKFEPYAKDALAEIERLRPYEAFVKRNGYNV